MRHKRRWCRGASRSVRTGDAIGSGLIDARRPGTARETSDGWGGSKSLARSASSPVGALRSQRHQCWLQKAHALNFGAMHGQWEKKAPPAPAHLSEEARRWWQRTCKDYELSPHHLLVLQAAAESWDRAQQARKALDLEGLTVQGEHGPKTHPAVAVEVNSRTLFVRCLRELSLDTVEQPGARP